MAALSFIPVSAVKRAPVPLSSGAFLPWAHHPHCGRHLHHLIWIGDRPFCLGCTSATAGALLGIFTLALVDWRSAAVASWIVVHLLALIPTVIQPWLQRKWFKVTSRGLLGAAVVSYWGSGLFLLNAPIPPVAWATAMACAFVAMYLPLRQLRNLTADNPCKKCPMGVYPTCDWNLPRLVRDPDLDREVVEWLRSNRPMQPTSGTGTPR